MVVLLHTKASFDQALKRNDVVLVDFFADWCGPCRVIAPFVKSLAEEFSSLYVCKVDVDNSEEIATACEISAMPTFHIYVKGEKVDELIGASKDALKEMVLKHVGA